MRSFIMACLALGLVSQFGCALTTKSIAQNKPVMGVKDGDKFLEAKAMEEQGKLESAREMYEELLEKQPEEPTYLHRLAVVCTRLQRYGEANSLYERARLKDPKNVRLLSDMGYSAYMRGDYAAAEQVLREAVRLKPSFKRASTNLALVMGRQGKFDESLELLRAVSSEANALASLAYIHTLRGEYDLAELRYRAALEIDPNLQEATQGLAELPKKKPAKVTTVAEAKPAREETNDFASLSSPPAKIQQASATKDDFDGSIKTADFIEDFSQPEKPRRLVDDDEPSWMNQPTTSGVTTANRVTLEPTRTPPKKLAESDFDEDEDPFAKPASFDSDE